MSDTTDRRKNGESADELAILSQVAHMYYDLHMLQPEIAQKLFFSRSKVSRMLQKAQDMGIVEINVKRYLTRMPSYEKKIQALFGVEKVVVFNNYDDNDVEDSENGLINYAANYISNHIKGNCVMGITGSHTVTQIVHQLKHVHDCRLKVVQTIGATINHDISVDLVNFLARTYDGNAYFLNTPVYADDIYVKEALLKDPAIKKTFALMKNCDLLLMGIGRFDRGGDMPLWDGYLDAHHRQELADFGAVGSICARYYDINGKQVPSEWNKKCITIPWEDIMNAKKRIVIARGQYKAEGILGALRGGLVDVLFTDTTTAAAVMERNNAVEFQQARRNAYLQRE